MNTKTDDGITNINEFVEWTRGLKGSSLLYRGLSDSDWKLEASGYRRRKFQGGDIPAAMFPDSIDQLLDSASLQGLRKKRDGGEMSDLELLAEMQHNGAATCLIDFTTDPLIALWFACRENLEKSGKVCAMRTDERDSFSKMDYEELKNKKIKELLDKEKLWKWHPGVRNNRMIAQSSVFVFGKGEIEESCYKTFEIKQESKKGILEELKDKFGINELHLFGDFTGFCLANAHDKQYTSYSPDYYRDLAERCEKRDEHEKAKMYHDKAIESSKP